MVTMLLIVIAVFSGLIVMIESLEQIRRFGEYGLSGLAVLKMAALRLPDSLYELLPIVVVLATLAMFLGLARSSELVVTRAAGRSALRALVPPLIVSILFGVLTVTVIGPIAGLREPHIRTTHHRARRHRRTGLFGGLRRFVAARRQRKRSIRDTRRTIQFRRVCALRCDYAGV